MAENRDSFELNVSMTGVSLKAQGRVTALLAAILSIGSLTVAALYAREIILPKSSKQDSIQGKVRGVRSIAAPDEPRSIKKPYAALGITFVAIVTSVLLGRHAYRHLGAKVRLGSQ